jgi:heme-degrading monooxygenase HmoA
VHAVVNRLRFADPVDAAVIERFRGAMDALRVEPGCLDLKIVQVAPDEVVLLIFFDSPESLEDITARVGNAAMREHIVPLLRAPTERIFGPVVASLRG